jgi:hypothetical protein
MTGFRGIPDPKLGDMSSIFRTVHALKEAVERDAQGLRTRSLQSQDTARAQALQRSRYPRAWPSEASLSELRDIVAALDVSVTANTAAIAALDARLVTAEATIVDHETRITALEP